LCDIYLNIRGGLVLGFALGLNGFCKKHLSLILSLVVFVFLLYFRGLWCLKYLVYLSGKVHQLRNWCLKQVVTWFRTSELTHGILFFITSWQLMVAS
jgi:hypothetical protein